MAFSSLADIDVYPVATSAVTRIPYAPLLNDLDGTLYTQHSSSNFTLYYNLPTDLDWDGVMLRFDDWGARDLSSITGFVFAVRGTPANAKVEFEDAGLAKTIAILHNVTNTWQYYNIPASQFVNNRSQIRVIAFVTDYGLSGAGRNVGHLEVLVRGLSFDWRLNGTESGTPYVLPGTPSVLVVGGGNADTVITVSNQSLIEVDYQVTNGWSGATLSFDDPETSPAVESQDLSGITNLTFGLWGAARNVKVEIEDTNGVKQIITCTNVTATEKFYTINTTMLDNDATAIRAINFVVDAGLVAEGSLAGRLQIRSGGLNYTVHVAGTPSGVPTVLPDTPALIPVGGANPDTLVKLLSSSDFQVFYNVTSGWSGATILYDDYSTGPIEYADLSGYSNLVFGITGTPQRVKLEVQDASGRKAAAFLDDLGPGMKYYALSREQLTNLQINVSQVASISFVVDAQLAGEGNLLGMLAVTAGGFDYPELPPLPAGPATVLPPIPLSVQPVGGANPDTRLDQYSSDRLQVFYHVASGWSGVSIIYDDFGTVPVETRDFSSRTSVVFGVKGSAERVKIEFVDGTDSKVEYFLSSVAPTTQYYEVTMAALSNRGLQVASMRMINFVVDALLAGNPDGQFSVWTGGLPFSNQSYPGEDSDGDGLPNDWEELHGLDPYDDGSVDPRNGAWGDPDGDGAGNRSEHQSGTRPDSASSAPYLRMTRQPGDAIQLSLDVGPSRRYRVLMTDNLITGSWSTVASFNGTEPGVANVSTGFVDPRLFFCYQVLEDEVTRLPGQPQAVVVGGGDLTTVLTQSSHNEVLVQYTIADGEWAGVTFLYDDYATEELEYMDLSGYSELKFELIGSPQSVKYEVEDTNGVKVAGLFRYINDWQIYTLQTADLAAQGLDLSRVRFINFLVDVNTAGLGNTNGSFRVKSWGLAFTHHVDPEGSGTPSFLPPPGPRPDNLGGGQSVDQWVQTGATNLYVPYNVTPADTWDGVALLYDDFGTPEIETADFSEMSVLTLALSGNPQTLKVEVEDKAGARALVYLQNVSASVQYYDIVMDEVAAAGVNTAQIRFINFVVDQTLAGAGPHEGAFTVITDGLFTP